MKKSKEVNNEKEDDKIEKMELDLNEKMEVDNIPTTIVNLYGENISKATLIIVPVSLLQQWKNEFIKFVVCIFFYY